MYAGTVGAWCGACGCAREIVYEREFGDLSTTTQTRDSAMAEKRR
jgi:hypothetical protein